MTEALLDQGTLQTAFGCFPSGVTALCAELEGTPVGMAVSSFTSVSLDPPLISVSIQDTSRTWVDLRRASHIGVSVLADDHGDYCRKLSLKEGDRFEGVPWAASTTGAVYIEGAAATFECTLHEEIRAGDHSIALLEVQALTASPDSTPLVFHSSKFKQLA
ncbi:flavin reductase family protein [Paenarthrobacter aurescens]|uniref:Flavin reductase like domain protein (Oxidoreductase) n=1 Tax=Paenarthrobacter aurescens (strain TC1) TaxID=290340 RepID=A1RDH2_PAEAT|nr:flavin reductase family protein [Paenarthrobacter aurescens]ABM10683.1 putative flavin reductase like domain protein (oxidoreductase) [Paenarthrobacter aurescens TC1]